MNEMTVLVEGEAVYFDAEQVLTMLDNSSNLSAVRDDLRTLLIQAQVDLTTATTR